MRKFILIAVSLIASCSAILSKASSEPSANISTPVVRGVSTASPNNLGPMYREYQRRLYDSVSRALTPLSLLPGEKCKIKIFQSTIGKVFKVEFFQCLFSLPERDDVRSLLVGVQLPHAGYEPVAGRQLFVTVCAQEMQCEP